MANPCVVMVVLVLGILACILGIAGALNSIKDSDITITTSGCSHPTKPGLAFGVIGSLCILAAQITANVAARTCICCCTKRAAATTGQCCAIVCLVLSWLFAISSFSNLLAGGVINSSSYPPTLQCYYPNPVRYLVAGVIGALLATILALEFYSRATSVSNNMPTYHGNVDGVEMPLAPPYPIHAYPRNPPPYHSNPPHYGGNYVQHGTREA